MQQSNSYIIIFSVAMTVIIGGLLAGVSQVLKEPQRRSVELDTKKQILGAVLSAQEISSMSGEQLLARYASSISSEVTDINGDIISERNGEPVFAENVDIARNFRLNANDRLYPVFKFHQENNPDAIEAFILPIYGNGLWDNIWGYVALDTDLKTIKGVKFDHAAETPGLGARITEGAVQERFRGKKILNDDNELVSVSMLKGENNPESALGPHRVDGMSGATITANGVNDMMKNYLSYYQKYFELNASERLNVASLFN